MTSPTNTAAPTGVPLVEKCAELMGYRKVTRLDGREGFFEKPNGQSVVIAENWSKGATFRPDVDERHAAEVRRWATSQWGGKSKLSCSRWVITEDFTGFRVSFFCGDKEFFEDNVDFCIATCRVFIVAAEALQSGAEAATK